MFTRIFFFCLIFAICIAQPPQNCTRMKTRLSGGSCPIRGGALCRDSCTGKPVGTQNCSDAIECCLNNRSVCVIRRSSDISSRSIQFLSITQENILFWSQLQNTLQRGASTVLSSCPQPFPFNCPISHEHQVVIESPVNIPYCQRIPCSPSDLLLDTNYVRCVSHPGCYFDNELYTYRMFLGQAILPDVPVCHLAIRNKAFKRIADNVTQQIGSWNPLLTSCLLNEYDEDIFGDAVGCQLINLLQYFNYKPKKAGWKNITQKECALIGACPKEDGCFYPVKLADQPTIPSSNIDQNSLTTTFGLPLCQHFSSVSSGDQFLTEYHACLTSGCAVNVNFDLVKNQLLLAGRNLTIFTKSLYLNMIDSGQVRPYNYKQILKYLETAQSNLPFDSAPHIQQQQQQQHPIIGYVVPFNLSLHGNSPNSIRFGQPRPLHNQKNTNQELSNTSSTQIFSGTQINKIDVLNYISQLRNKPHIFGGKSFLVELPSSVANYNPCPYHEQNLYYPDLPKLSGSFEGCCEKPLCYLPKQDLYSPYSGISSYLSQWSDWGECSASCGGGTQNRTRTCVGENCSSNAAKIQNQVCNRKQCSRYQTWNEWSTCSATCGGGFKVRSRVCYGSGRCEREPNESRRCRTGKCPTYEFEEWSLCSSTCGSGIRNRRRVCVTRGAYGCSPQTEAEPCTQFCGQAVTVCNIRTCCYEAQCRSGSGIPGVNCSPSTDRRVGTRCYQNQCRYAYNVQCNISG